MLLQIDGSAFLVAVPGVFSEDASPVGLINFSRVIKLKWGTVEMEDHICAREIDTIFEITEFFPVRIKSMRSRVVVLKLFGYLSQIRDHISPVCGDNEINKEFNELLLVSRNLYFGYVCLSTAFHNIIFLVLFINNKSICLNNLYNVK